MNGWQDVPIKVIHLFEGLDSKLLGLLRSLPAEDWHRPTVAKLWTIKDIAAHLLDGNLRMLSMSRDNYLAEYPGNLLTYQDLVDYLNGLNADWVKAMKRVSHTLLMEGLSVTGRAYTEHVRSLDPFDNALFPVSWAGEQSSKNWFHIAREYTEKWIHQQQIRYALGNNELMTRTFFYPLIDVFMRGLPHTYRNIEAAEGTAIKVSITTTIGGEWYFQKRNQVWQLANSHLHPEAEMIIDPETAWKLFSKAITPVDATPSVIMKGKKGIGRGGFNNDFRYGLILTV